MEEEIKKVENNQETVESLNNKTTPSESNLDNSDTNVDYAAMEMGCFNSWFGFID